MEMTITSGDQSVKTTREELRDATALIKGERYVEKQLKAKEINRMSCLKDEKLGKALKDKLNHEMFPINLKEYVDRIIKLADDKKEIQDFIALVYEEAASKGFDKKALKDAIKMLKMEKVERDYHLELTSLYLEKIG